MKLLYLTRHENLGASSRYRSIQFFAEMERRGAEIRHRPFFSDRYLRSRRTRVLRAGLVAMAFARRVRALVEDAAWADAIVAEKEIFPYLPASIDNIIHLWGKPIVLDFDDAVWHANYAWPTSLWMRGKSRQLAGRARQVVVGSHYIQDEMVASGQRSIALVPTSVPRTRYYGQGLGCQKDVDVVWIGSPSTVKHLASAAPALTRLHREHGVTCRAIGVPEDMVGLLPRFFELHPWSAETELPLLSSARLGIMPLPDLPFERGKCAFKIVQYMGLGLPVVASPVGENHWAVTSGRTGYLASSAQDWQCRILALLKNEKLRETMGAQGFRRYTEVYSSEVSLESWWKLLRDVTSGESMRR